MQNMNIVALFKVPQPGIAYFRRAKLGQIQGELQRPIQDSTKGGVAIFFYALRIELFRVFTLND